jgi:hypothetical protein
MTIILSFSDTASLRSVMIYCTTLETFSMSVLDKLAACTQTCCGRCGCTRCCMLFTYVCGACASASVVCLDVGQLHITALVS